MSYMTGRPKGALPAIVPGFSGMSGASAPCKCATGDDASTTTPIMAQIAPAPEAGDPAILTVIPPDGEPLSVLTTAAPAPVAAPVPAWKVLGALGLMVWGATALLGK